MAAGRARSTDTHQNRIGARRIRCDCVRRTYAAASECCGDRGSATVELVILAPALVITLLFVIAAGRITTAHAAVEAAARDAARQASLARDPATARINATTSAQASLTRQGLNCPAHITVDTSGFARPVGQPATVTVHVTCRLNLADVAAAGLPGIDAKARFTSPIDPHRGKTVIEER